MSNYAKYDHLKVKLSDILNCIEEMEADLTRGLLREEANATEESLKQKIGKIQGLHSARQRIELHYGEIEEVTEW